MNSYLILESTALKLIPVLEEFCHLMQSSDCDASAHTDDMQRLLNDLKTCFPTKEYYVDVSRIERNTYNYRVRARSAAEAQAIAENHGVNHYDCDWGNSWSGEAAGVHVQEIKHRD